MKKKFTFLIAAAMLLTMITMPGNVAAQTAIVGTELWKEPFKGTNISTSFSATSSWGDYVNPTTFVAADASSLSYSSSNAMLSSSSGANMDGAHVWINKKTTGYIQVSGIQLYNAKKVKVYFDQGGSGSVDVYYQFDGSGSFTKLSGSTAAGANIESDELTVTGHTTIALKFQRTSNNNNLRIDDLTLKVTEIAAPSGTTAAPSIDGNNPFLTNTTVTITNAASADGADIFYTLNGDDPTTTTSATCFAYSAPFEVSATTTVKAIAKKSTDTNASSVVSKTFTKVTPMTVSDALTVISSLGNNGTSADKCVSGIVCTAGSLNSGAITYYISDDGTTTNRLQVYKGKGLYNADFTAATDIAVGDEVVVYGTLKNFNGNTPEFDQGSYLLSKVRNPAVFTSETELTGFTYAEGNGPSTAQTVAVSGSNLTADISLSLGENSNFEMSTNENSGYTSSLTLTQTEGAVSATNIYARLKSGLTQAANYEGTITITSTGAANKTVSLSGSVTAATHAITQYSDPAIAHGTITFAPASPVAEGTEVTLSAEAAAGYDFTANSWVVYKEVNSEWVTDNLVTVSSNKLTMPTYDIKVGGTFTAKPTYGITCVANPVAGGTLGTEPSSAYEGQTATLTYTEETGYILSTVVITKTSDGTATGITPTAGAGKTFTFTMPGYAVTATATFITGVTDVLTRTTTGIDNGGGYGDWSGKTSNSDAEYAGRSAGGNNSIQLRDKNNSNTPGIVTTSTGGKVKKISVSWNSNTTSGRYITVYGKTSAYSGYSDLYSNNSSTVGTSLGTIVCGTSTELTVTGNYDYIGIKASEPLYLDQINITWDPIKYTITYDANGGSGTMTDPNSPYTSNSTVTVLSNSFTGPVVSEVTQEFARWNTKADGSGTNYNPGATFNMPKENVTLYAQWIAPCTLTATMDDAVLTASYVAGENRIKLDMLSDVYALGGCDITDYGFVYSTSVSTPTIGTANCEKIVVGTEYGEAGDYIEYSLADATLGATYYVRSYAINNAGTAYSDVASVTIDSSYPTYTISYSTNGYSDGSSTINQGNAMGTLPTPTESYIPDGYEFVGWYNGASYGSTTYPTLITTATVPTGDMNLKAIFKISPSGGEQCIEITVDDLTGSNNYTTTHSFTKGTTTFNAYGVYKNNGIQMNSGKDTYIKNTNTLPGVVTRFAMTWSSGTSVNTITMYANGGAVASTSSTKLAKLSAGTSQSINDLVDSNYNYFYLDGTTVTGACVMSSFKIYYIDYYYTTSAIVPSGETWHVDGSGELTDNSTIPAGSYTLTSTITVPSGKTLTINGYLGTTAEHLIIEDGGQLIVNTSGVQATVKKAIAAPAKAADHWYTISSPVNNIGITSVTNLVLDAPAVYDLYRYDEPTHMWENYKNATAHPDFTNLTNGRGYLYYNSTGADLEFAGEINVSDVEISLTANGDKLTGFNLIGNPYSHDIYKGAGTAIVNSVSEGYELATGFYTLTDQSAWAAGTDNTTAIKPSQGFLVQATTAGTLTITNTNAIGGAKAKNEMIQFTVANSQYEDVAYALFEDAIGLNKIEHINPEVPMLYIAQDGQDYAIATMERSTTVFDLNLNVATTGEYTLSTKALGSYDYLHLFDRMTGIDIDLLATDKYTFNSKPRDYMYRFEVRLSENASTGSATDETFAFFNGSEWVISNTGRATLQVVDVMGRVLVSETVEGDATLGLNEVPGVYVMRLVKGESVKTQKIVVR